MNNKKQIMNNYVREGLYVLPLRDGEKTPRLKGWQEKSTINIETIEGWIEQYPNANYGIQTGEKSGVWVLDIDIKNGKNGLLSLKKEYPEFDLDMLDTPIVQTPNGGYHVYFKYPAGTVISNSTDVLSGIDVRSNGGYVVAPPSALIIDGDYCEYQMIRGSCSHIAEAPEYLLKLVNKKKVASNVVDNEVSLEALLDAQIIINDLSGVGEGGRDDYIFKVVCSNKIKGLSKDETLIEALVAAENCSPPFDEECVYEKVNRIYSSNLYSNVVPLHQKKRNETDKEGDIIKDFNRRYAVVRAGTKTLVLDEERNENCESINDCLSTFEDFHKFYSNMHIEVKEGNKKKRIHASKYWIEDEDRRGYENIVFDPSESHKDNEYNFWKGFPVSQKKGDTGLFWGYLRNVICRGDEESYVYLRKWIAHIFQKPEELPRTAVVITGKQGTGKSTLTKILSKLLYNQNYLEVSTVERMLGTFNSSLANRLLVNANEAIWGGDKAHSGALKALITDSNMTIEMKGRDSFQYTNYARYIFTTNSSYPVNIDADDRRFVFLECSDEKKGDASYWKQLNDSIENNEALSALMYDLQNEDITNWNPEERPICNLESYLGLKHKSMTNIEKFVYEWIQNKSVEKYDNSNQITGGYMVDFSEFYNEYRAWGDDSRIKDNYTTNQALATTIRDKLIPINKTTRGNGKTYWHMGSWRDIYEYYCDNVIYCDPEWNKEDSCSVENKASNALKMVMGGRRG